MSKQNKIYYTNFINIWTNTKLKFIFIKYIEVQIDQ